MKLAEIWTAAAGTGYAGKPRPVVIVQDDRFDGTTSVTVCPFTSDVTDVPLVRPLVQPSPHNGLDQASRLMVDKLNTMRRDKLGQRMGVLSNEDMMRLERSMVVFLGLAG